MKLTHTLKLEGKTISGRIVDIEWGNSERGDCKHIWMQPREPHVARNYRRPKLRTGI